MKRNPTLAILSLLISAVLPAQTPEITLLAPGGIRAAVEQIIPGFEKQTGYKVKATFGSGLGTKKQIAEGQVFDVPILQPPLDEVLATGNLVAASAKPLASVAVGIAVRKGAPKPDISTTAALRKTLLASKSVAFPDPGAGAAAGVSFELTLKKLGIAAEIEPRLKRAQGGAGAMAMAAKGEAEIGLTFLSEMNEPGIEIVGPLPADVSTPTTLIGYLSTHSKNVAAAKALLDYLSSPAATPFYKSTGMQALR